MSDIAFFSRIKNLFKGFLSLFIADIEKEHPEIAYENAINSMVEKHNKLKYAAGAVIRRREDIDERLKKATRELAQAEAQLAVAVETGQDDLALVLIQKKDQLSADVTALKAEAETSTRDAESIKGSLLQVQGEINKLKGERDTMVARMRSAQAQIKIQEQLDGLSLDAEVKALDTVRDHIKTTIATANLGRELSESSLDSRLNALKSQTGEVQAKAQLAELKAKRAAQQAQAQRSM